MLLRPLGLCAALVLSAVLAGCGSDDADVASDDSSDPSSSTPTTDPAEPTVSCTYTEDGTPAARPVDPPPSTPTHTDKVSATIATSRGDLQVELFGDTTPCTVNSFVSLAEQGYYDKTPCPRVTNTPGFQLLQCGDPTGTTGGGPGYTFADELTGSETYPAGALAMANAGPDTNGSQFFVVYGDTGLPPSYTVFGTVVGGLGVIKKVGAAGDDGSNPAGGGAPLQKIDITKVTID